MARLTSLLALLSAGTVAAKRYNTGAKRVEGALNVHIVPHTHDDCGWLKTFDQYLYGTQNGIQRAMVADLISSVIKELYWNPDRKFVYVESAFFEGWWNQADEFSQNVTRQLVAEGRLEFINGGYTMHDEANPSFPDMVDGTTLGHRFLLKTFGVTPKTTWQIDPFGHSGFQAFMSSPLAGYDAVFFAREDYQEAQQRGANRSLENIWAPSASLGMNAATLSGKLYYHYGPPPGFDMNVYSNDNPVVDDAASPEFNLGQSLQEFVEDAANQFKNYRGSDIMFTFGSDFNYENAATWFNNMDRMIDAVNQDGRFNAFYSTPSIYAAAKRASVPSFPSKTTDYMPYADGPHSMWSGYFTSRAALKGYIRDSSSVFQAAKLLQAAAARPVDVDSPANPLLALERAQSLAQHHDAVAGTSKQAVAFDYARRIAAGRAQAETGLFAPAFAQLTGYSNASFASCELINGTVCPALEAAATGPVVMLLYSAQAQANAATPVMVPVPTGPASYAVTGPDGKPVTAQLLPLSAADLYLRTTYYNYSGPAVQWLAFQASSVAGGYAAYVIAPAAAAHPHTHQSKVRTVTRPGAQLRGKAGATQTITNGVLTLTFDSGSGKLTSFANAADGIDQPFQQSFFWYNSSDGNFSKGGDTQAGGAYIMRTDGDKNERFAIAQNGIVELTLVTGPVVNEARQTWASWVSNSVRLWAGAQDAVFDYQIGPIPIGDNNGKEVIASYASGVASAGQWYSDANGRDSMLRLRNARRDFNYTNYNPVAGNVVPQNTFSWLTDGKTTLSVANDRSQGCASMQDGELELLVQRRLLADDSRGVGEPLNETGLTGEGLVIRGVHRVSLRPAAAAGATRRAAVADLLYRPIPFFAPTAAAPAAWLSQYKPTWSALTAPLPPQLHLLTAHALSESQVLVRISHSFETGEDATLSQPASVNLATLLAGTPFSACTETTVTANQPLASARQVTYNVDGGQSVTLPVVPPAPAGAGLQVTLGPMEIRTFLCTVA